MILVFHVPKLLGEFPMSNFKGTLCCSTHYAHFMSFPPCSLHTLNQEKSSSHQIYQGVRDSISTSMQDVIPEIRARYIRINPLAWNVRICLRVEIYGCDLQDADIGVDSSFSRTFFTMLILC